MFEPGHRYNKIYFGGAGYYMPYHLGIVKCFQEYDISFQKTFGISSGGLAAFAMLGGGDIDLAIRQIFDVAEKNILFGWDYMLKVLLTYLEVSRKGNKMTLEEINGRFHTGLIEIKSFSRKFKNTFSSEDELINSVVNGTNVIPFISLGPVSYKGGWYIDPLMIDEEDIDLAITPFSFSWHLPKAKKTIYGDYWFCFLLYPIESVMKDSFYKGYAQAKSLIKPSLSIKENILNSKEILDEIFERKKNWKCETGIAIKKLSKKGHMKEVELLVPNNFWDKFLISFKKNRFRYIYPFLISVMICWILLKFENI